MSKGIEINDGKPNYSSVIQEANRLGWQTQDLRDGKAPDTERFKAQLRKVVENSLALLSHIEGKPMFELSVEPVGASNDRAQEVDEFLYSVQESFTSEQQAAAS